MKGKWWRVWPLWPRASLALSIDRRWIERPRICFRLPALPSTIDVVTHLGYDLGPWPKISNKRSQDFVNGWRVNGPWSWWKAKKAKWSPTIFFYSFKLRLSFEECTTRFRIKQPDFVVASCRLWRPISPNDIHTPTGREGTVSRFVIDRRVLDDRATLSYRCDQIPMQMFPLIINKFPPSFPPL